MQQLVFLPDNAPFTESQRAWLNGFVAGLLGMERAQATPGATPPAAEPQIDEDFPWHDPTLALEERMKLASGRPFERQLMAAMGQLDCGQCGYLCKTYAESIAIGAEADLGKCVPGGRITAKKIKELLARQAKDEADRSRLCKLAEDDSRADALGVHDVLDALLEFPSARPSIVEFVAALARMQPRLYSIACSQKRHPREVHLTVSVLRYEKNDRSYVGTGSGFLSEHLRPGRALSVFVQRAHAFRLPADLAAQVIMVGPGTGIAPFRAFLQERAAAGAAGRNWLFFGNHRREADFLYRTELEEFAVRRVLSRMDLAFSRDQTSKVYVQHKMLEAAQELWRWLANGAYLYVCGDAQRMAGDVDLALQQIAVTQGGMDSAAAKRFLVELAKAGRYQRDVY